MPHLRREIQGLADELRQRRRMRLLVRSTWLALLWIGVGLVLRLLGIHFNLYLLLIPAVIILLISCSYAWFSTPSLVDLMQTFDRHYGLHQHLATALEVAEQRELYLTAALATDEQRDQTGVVTDRLLEQATMTVRQVYHAVASRPLVPWREWETLAAVVLVLGGLTLAQAQGLPGQGQPVSLPPLPSPVAVLTATPEAAQDQPVVATPPPPSPEQQAAMDAIADALQDTGATRPAADALQQGDAQGAAEALEQLAQAGDQLGQSTREDLAEGLQEAADQLRPSQPNRAAQLDQAAQQMAENPQQGLQELADLLEDLSAGSSDTAQAPGEAGGGDQANQPNEGEGTGEGQQPGAGAGNGLGGERRSNPSQPPDASGDTLPLPPPETNDGPTTNATGPKGPTVELGAGGVGNAGGGGGSGSNAPLPGEADPLRIPPEDRDVVENYFSSAP